MRRNIDMGGIPSWWRLVKCYPHYQDTKSHKEDLSCIINQVVSDQGLQIVATGFLATMAFGQSRPSNVDATADAGSDGSLRETPRLDRAPEPVAFVNGDVRLAGGLVKPVGHGPFPAVIFVHGAGPAAGNEPAFVVHANAFLSRGFAVLMYDKARFGWVDRKPRHVRLQRPRERCWRWGKIPARAAGYCVDEDWRAGT